MKSPWQTWFDFLTFLLGVEYDHGSEPNKKMKMGKLNSSKKKKKNQKWLKLMSQKGP